MRIIINNASQQPIYEQIVDQVKSLIIDGELQEHQILPSVRALSKELKISALTVKKAYDNLEQEDVYKRQVLFTRILFLADLMLANSYTSK